VALPYQSQQLLLFMQTALHAKLSFVIMLTGTGWSHGCLASGIVTGWCMPQSKMFSS